MDRKSVDLSVAAGFSVSAIMMSLCFGCSSQSSGGSSGIPKTSQNSVSIRGAGDINEVPGYIVELVGASTGQASTDETLMQPSCIGTHIGEGFILTAANCVFAQICKQGGSAGGLSSLRLRHRTSEDSVQVVNSGAIQAIAYHKHLHIVSSDNTVSLPGFSAAHNIALIKVSSDIQEAAKVPLPSDGRFSSDNISGKLHVYHPKRNSKLGSMGSVKKISDKAVKAAIRTQMTAWFTILMKAVKSVSQSAFKRGRQDPAESDTSTAHLATNFPSCFSLGAGGAIESISAHSFSEDGSMDADPAIKALNDRYTEALVKAYVEFQKPADTRDESLINRGTELITEIAFRLIKDAFFIEFQGDRKTGFCLSHSGGPVLQRRDDDVVMGVLGEVLEEGAVSINAQKDASGCGSYIAVSSTYHNLSWINAAKASISSGNHRVVIQGKNASMVLPSNQ